MTDRSNLPDGLEVHSTDFDNLNTQSTTHLKTRFTDSSKTGVVTGLLLTRNVGDTTKFDVSAGRGYAPNGELLDLASATTAISLTDYTATAVNIVCLVYTEAGSKPRAHETEGTTKNTTTVRSSRLKVFTTAQFAALLATSTDMTVDTVDRSLIIGRIVAQGFASLGVPNALDRAQILGLNDIAYALSPYSATFDSVAPRFVTGVELRGPGMTTTNTLPATGNGSLRLITSTSPPTLQWLSPFGGDALGATVNITAAGSYTLTSNLGQTMLVYASPELFPGSGTHNETVSIAQTLYIVGSSTETEQSATDRIHRRQGGTVSKTITNTHGVRGSDISPVLRVEQGVVLGANTIDDNAHSQIPRLVTPLTTIATRTLVSAYPAGAGPVYIREYVSRINNAREHTVNARWNGTAWTKDTDGSRATYRFTSLSSESFYIRAATNNGTWASWSDTGERLYTTSFDDAAPQARGLKTPRDLEITYEGASASDARGGGLKVDIDAGTTTRWQVMDVPNAANGMHYRKYIYVLGSTMFFEETINARWDGTNWNRDIAGGNAMYKFYSTVTEGVAYQDTSATASWALWTNFRTVLAIADGLAGVIQDGRIGMPWTTTTGSPNPTSAITNSFCSKNLIKAWVRLNWVVGTPPNIQDGFNIASIANIGTGPGDWGTRVTMASPMVNSSCPCVSATLGHPISQVTDGAVGMVRIDNITTTTFDVRVTNDAFTTFLDPAGATLNGFEAHIMVLGVQA